MLQRIDVYHARQFLCPYDIKLFRCHDTLPKFLDIFIYDGIVTCWFKERLFALISFCELFLDFIELIGRDIFHETHIQDGVVTYPVICITIAFH